MPSSAADGARPLRNWTAWTFVQDVLVEQTQPVADAQVAVLSVQREIHLRMVGGAQRP